MAKFMDKIKDFIAGPYDDDYDEYDYDGYDDEEEEYHAPARSSRTQRESVKEREHESIPEYTAPKTSSRRSQPQVVDFGAAQASSSEQQVVIIKPITFEDAQAVTDQMKLKRPVVVNLEKLEFPVAQRVMDFLSGTCYALEGKLQRVSKQIFIIAPVNYNISSESMEEPKLAKTSVPSWMGLGGR